ncbi:DUF3159 domain-containing protein [Sciscionella marina]|uniref:DUF3159 domain-containing protein n=1 Tax=Sciscionella marina TaxID=508770 RepID=UPI00036AE20D
MSKESPTEATEAETGEANEAEKAEKPEPTLLEQMGGISGAVYSAVPVIVFVVVNAVSSLMPAIWAAVGSAVLILVLRLVRREPIQPAISSVFGVAIAAFIAYRTGSAKGYFAYGIWTSVVLGAAFLISAVVRWPLAGVAWSFLNSLGMAWRSDKLARRYYDIATLVWVLVFGARFVVQQYLYQENLVGWLAAARIGMGLPLAAVAALVTIWAVHRADKRMKEIAEPEQPEPAESAAETARQKPLTPGTEE